MPLFDHQIVRSGQSTTTAIGRVVLIGLRLATVHVFDIAAMKIAVGLVVLGLAKP